MNSVNVVKSFRKFRIAYGLSQSQVARILRTSRGRIANLEHFRTNPSPAYLEKLVLLQRTVETFSENLLQIVEQ